MPNNETLYNQFSDINALQQEKASILGIFEEIKTGIKGLNGLGFQIDSAKGMADLKSALQQVADLKAQLQKNNDALASSQKNINDLQDLSTKKAKENADSIKGQTQALKEQAATIEATKKSTKDLIDLSVQLTESSRAITAERKRLREELAAGTIGPDEFTSSMRDLKESELQVKDASTDVNQALKRITDEANNSEGSLNQLRAQLQLMTGTFDRLSEAERNAPEGQELQKKIADSVKNISELEQATGRFQRNVGNYSNSLASGFKSIGDEIEKLKQKQATFQNLNPVKGFQVGANQGGNLNTATDTAQYNNVTAAIQKLEQVQQIGFKTNQTYTQTVRQLQNAYIDLAHDGNVSTEFLKSFEEFVAKAQHSSNELRNDIKALGSQTRTFDLLSGGISTVATGFEIATGASALFGKSSEDTEKSIRKLIAVQSIANGVREFARQLTEKETLAGKAYSFIQNQIAIATDSSAKASLRFGAALKLTGIGLLVTGVILLVTALSKLSNESEKTKKSIDDLQGVSNETKEALKDMGDTVEDIAENSIKSLQDEISNLNSQFGKTPSAIEKANAALQLLKNRLGEATDVVGKFSAFDVFNPYTTGRALKAANEIRKVTTAIKEQEDEIAKLIPLLQLKDRQEAVNFAADNAIREANLIIDANQRVLSSEKATLKERLNAIDSNYAQRQQIVQENLKKEITAAKTPKEIIAAQAKAANDSELAERDHLEQLLKIRKQYAERIAKAILSAKTSELNDIIALNQAIIDADKAPATDRLVALSDYTRERLHIIIAAADLESKKDGLIAEEITAIEAKKNSDILALYRDVNAKKEAIITDFSEKEKEILDTLEGRGLRSNKAGFINTDDANKKFTDDAAKKAEAIAKIKEAVIQLGEELTDLAFSAAESNVDEELKNVSDLMDLSAERKNKELDAINQLSIAEKDKAKLTAQINADAAQRDAQLEKQRRSLERQKAKLERDKSIAEIIERTAVAVIGAVAAYPGPYGIALGVILGAIGAASLAKVIATPLPAYAKGVDNAPAGLSVWGEKGTEMLVDKRGNIKFSPKTASLIDLAGGETIYPADVTRKMLAGIEKEKSGVFNNIIIPKGYDNSELIEQNNEQIKLLRDLKNKPTSYINISDNSGWIEYEQRNIRS